jgi:hypothetical protein
MLLFFWSIKLIRNSKSAGVIVVLSTSSLKIRVQVGWQPRVAIYIPTSTKLCLPLTPLYSFLTPRQKWAVLTLKHALPTCNDDMLRQIAANIRWITNVRPVHSNVRLERRNLQVEAPLYVTTEHASVYEAWHVLTVSFGCKLTFKCVCRDHRSDTCRARGDAILQSQQSLACSSRNGGFPFVPVPLPAPLNHFHVRHSCSIHPAMPFAFYSKIR